MDFTHPHSSMDTDDESSLCPSQAMKMCTLFSERKGGRERREKQGGRGEGREVE